MVTILARNWWAVALRGLAGVLFGLAALLWPERTVTVLILFFGAYALVDGIFAVVSAVTSAGKSERWWVVLLDGIAGIAVGLITLFWPGVTALALIYLIAAWALVTGVFEIMAAIRLRREIEGEWLLAFSGVCSLILGVLLILFPGAGAIAFAWMIGAYALVFGVLLIALGLRLRQFAQRFHRHASA